MKHFISIFLLFSLISHAAGLYCPTGFSAVNGQKCLRIFRTNLKHLEAETDCSYFGGTLVTIKNAVDNRAVTNLAASTGAQNIWIGMFCFATGNTTTCYHDDNSGKVAYKNFASGNPMVPGNGGCVYMSTSGKTSGQWFSATCEVVGMPFICEVPPTIADPTCVHNYNGYCYIPSHELGLTTNTSIYTTAQAHCRAIGANLASIHSQREQNYVKSLYRNLPSIYSILLGAQAFLPETYDWVDGSNWDFDYRSPLDYNHDYHQKNCLELDLYSSAANRGLWYGANCEIVNDYLCKRKIAPASPVSTRPPVVAEKETINFQKALPHRQELVDFSNCNTTLLMAPGVITSLGYPNSKPPVAFCTWTVAVLGPYRVGLYFTDFSTYTAVNIYDENGNMVNSAQYNKQPFQFLGASNQLTLTHDSRYDATYSYHGFEAYVLPF